MNGNTALPIVVLGSLPGPPSPIQLKCHERVVPEEGHLTELLQAVHSDEEPGAWEDSGDDYEE